ncbi:MAG: alpha/beta hydrolase [Clostridia bacterium]|nr:alpha/beta hydrolase [Clostridia bacterium]
MSVFKSKKRRVAVICVIAVFVVVTAVCAAYLGDYYRADNAAISAFSVDIPVAKQMPDDGILVYAPEEIRAGFIFYPGGKVEYTAYEPLMIACAQKGILCVLIEMPFNLAVLDVNAAAGIQEQYPAVKNWYIGGHSLGGSMAAAYLADHTDDFDGLVLLGSYSTADLSGTSLDVLSIYGSEDTVLNREKYIENRANVPAAFTELIMDGGCHAYFGMYGPQDGDGTPAITNKAQIELTAEAIAEMVVG